MLSAEDARPVSPGPPEGPDRRRGPALPLGTRVLSPRRLNHVEASYDAARIGMRAILVKSHHHNTVMDLLAMSTWLADAPTPVYGGVALNTEVGGVNPSAVAMSLRMGGRCVWAPTVSARPHIDHHSHGGDFPSAAIDLLEKEESIFDEAGEVSADTAAVVDIVAETGTLLTGGHLDPGSMKALFSLAESKGVRRLLVQHPDFIVARPMPTSRSCWATAPTSSTRSRCTTPR